MEVSREGLAKFVSSLSEDDENDKAILAALKAMQQAWTDPEVRAVIEARQKAQAEDDALFARAQAEEKTARRENTNGLKPEVLAEEYAKAVMVVWEEENPANHPEPPWEDFARDRSVSDLEEWVRGHRDRVAARYFRASRLYSLMIERFLKGYNESPNP